MSFIIKSEERKLGKFSANIPIDVELKNLRLRTQNKSAWGKWDYRMGYDYRCPVTVKGLRGLKAAGIVTVQDLSGKKVKDLKTITGIGLETARKLTRIYGAAGGIYRGEGFPYEISIQVEIPDELVASVKEAGKLQAISILVSAINPSSIFADLPEKIRLKNVASVKAQMVTLQQELTALNKV